MTGRSPQEREKRLRVLRAMPYADYLLTAHWRDTRRIALAYAGHRCQLCNGGGILHVHHRTYERLGAEMMSDLVVLCERCHRIFHDRIGLTPALGREIRHPGEDDDG